MNEMRSYGFTPEGHMNYVRMRGHILIEKKSDWWCDPLTGLGYIILSRFKKSKIVIDFLCLVGPDTLVDHQSIWVQLSSRPECLFIVVGHQLAAIPRTISTAYGLREQPPTRACLPGHPGWVRSRL